MANNTNYDGDTLLSEWYPIVKANFADIYGIAEEHKKDASNPHKVTKSQVGLGNVDNTSDKNKPVSNAVQAALDKKTDKTNFEKHTSDKTNPHGVTKYDVGLGNVDNTRDFNKPLSMAAITAFKNVVGKRPDVLDWGIVTTIEIVPLNEYFLFWNDGYDGKIDTIISDGEIYLTYDSDGKEMGIAQDKLYIMKLTTGSETGKCVIAYEGDKDAFYMSLVSSHTHANKDILDGITGVDTTPKSGSNKLVTSGGVYAALEKKSDNTFSPSDYVSGESGIEDAPVGHIISIMSNSAPKHYLICDGTEYNIADYPYLSEHIKTEFGTYNYFGGDGTVTFSVPDLRGEFLRGVGTAERNTGSGAAKAGVHQDGTYIPYIGTNQNNDLIAYNNSVRNYPSNMECAVTDSNFKGLNIKPSVWSESTSGYKGYAARPTNTSVLYCIKYEPTYFMVNNNSYNGDVIGSGGLKIQNNKVDVDFDKVQAKETGKGLSQNDYTNADKALVGQIADKLDNIAASADEYNTGRIWLDGSAIYRKDFAIRVLDTSLAWGDRCFFWSEIGLPDNCTITASKAYARTALSTDTTYYAEGTGVVEEINTNACYIEWYDRTVPSPSTTSTKNVLNIWGYVEYCKTNGSVDLSVVTHTFE